jgi:hypothetical protein
MNNRPPRVNVFQNNVPCVAQASHHSRNCSTIFVLYEEEIFLYSSLLRLLVFNSKGNETMFRVYRQDRIKEKARNISKSGMDGKRAVLT